VCGRTMLKGEQAEPYLAPSRERRLVCQLCAPRAQQEGWIRESVNSAVPVHPPRAREGGRLLRWVRRRRPADRPSHQDRPVFEADNGNAANHERVRSGSVEVPIGVDPTGELSQVRLPREPPRDPRHVRAVPTNAQLKIERAMELFNGSEHLRTVAGIAKTLGEPMVSASTSVVGAAEVLLTIAWELSWYQFIVDLSDPNHPVRMLGRGEELAELSEAARDWNAHAEDDGSLAIGACKPESSNGDDPEEVL
jgi:hypothetical protein